MQPLLRDTIIEVNLDNIAYNMRKIKELVGRDVAIAAVVKADGYGLGAVNISPTIMENGADYLAVATLTEALELRNNYNNYKIMIMGYTPDEYLKYVVENDLVQTIFSLRQAKIIDDISLKQHKKTAIHIKYDTGFNRLGFKDCEESINEINEICVLQNLIVEGIFSHFALANKEEDDIQYKKFIKAIKLLEEKGNHFKFKHICTI
jgi:alanine racemase